MNYLETQSGIRMNEYQIRAQRSFRHCLTTHPVLRNERVLTLAICLITYHYSLAFFLKQQSRLFCAIFYLFFCFNMCKDVTRRINSTLL